MTASARDVRRLLPIAPALIVAVTALFAVPSQAGGFRLSKWSAFGFGLGALSLALLVRGAPLRLPKRWWPLGAFTALSVVLPAFSSTLAASHWPSALGMLSGLALFFATVITLEDDETARRANLVVLISCGALCALVVLLQAAGLRWLTSDVYTGLEFRSPGTFGNPNWAAAFIAPLVPIALALAHAAKRRWPFYATAAFLALATLATLSKGGVATLAAALLVYFTLGRNTPRRRQIALLTLTGACAAAVLTFAWQHDLAHASWLRGRIFLWRAALFMVAEHPLTGTGLGGYTSAYGRVAAAILNVDADPFMPLSTVDFTHHDLLQFAAEGGILTAAAFAVVVVATLMYAHRGSDPLSRAVGGAVAALVVNGFADSPLRVPSTFVLFFFLLGWLWPSSPATQQQRSLLGVIALLSLLQGVRFAAGNSSWTRGRAALAANQPAVEDLEQARFWIPEHGRSAAQYARALARAGRFKDALAASNTAASLRFDFDDEIFRRDLQSRSLDRASAIQLWQDFSAKYPALVTPYLRLGVLYLRDNNRPAAIAGYRAVLANPQPTARAEAARKQARSLLQSLLAVSPRAPGSEQR